MIKFKNCWKKERQRDINPERKTERQTDAQIGRQKSKTQTGWKDRDTEERTNRQPNFKS